ncbi:DUF2827 domain-containing protein [Burkholderia ubonensis]|uniref:DUF2827 domain-containing protein n=1 Tax=Burkholderia ubonensis TaxID=101571 RepID=UPI000A9EA39A|nr:DUF2827 domain-containing protein [Burkholderia ubonensis]
MSSVRVGITIGLHESAETVWNNGIKQNAIFLAEAMWRCPQVRSVVLVNTTDVPITAALPWSQERYPTRTFEAVKDDVDILIELGGQIDAHQTAYLKQRGVRLISYCCGSEYVLAMESVLFRKRTWGEHLFVNQRYDDIWMIPQIERSSRAYFEVFRRQQARVVPFVWSPMFLEARAADLPREGIYHPSGELKRLSVMEPNINVVKFCLYPILIAELAFRERPGAIQRLQVTNAKALARESIEFVALMNQLDIVRAQRAVFLDRYETPAFLAEHTDIVISHQLENPLNYFYLEVCWQGYALIHNASMCRELGYYYPDNDVTQGALRVVQAIDTHDADAARYRERQRGLIARFLPNHPDVIAAYSALLDDVMTRVPR